MDDPMSKLSNAENEEDSLFYTPQQADELLKPEIDALIIEGWSVVTWSTYLVRLKKDDQIMDVQVNLDGTMHREQKTAIQTSAEIGRLIVGLILLVAFLMVFVLASILEFI